MAYPIEQRQEVLRFVPIAFIDRLKLGITYVVPLSLAVNILLVVPILFPTLKDVTGFGEAAYVNNGRLLAHGILTPFGYSPLSSFFYALTYIPVHASAYWLVQSCTIGRVVLFSLLWIGGYLVATTVRTLSSPFVMVLLLLASPVLPSLIVHGSHALFAAVSAFALWQFLLFYRTQATKHLWRASFFIGAAVLTRSGEGLVLWAVVIALTIWIGNRSRELHRRMAACILPCAIVVGCYIVGYRVVAGAFDLGISEYSYFAFEQGHGLAFQSEFPEDANFYVDGQIPARRLFGTAEENGYSVATAIRRNPKAYFSRIPRLIRLIPAEAMKVYGLSFGFVALLLAGRGIIELIRRKRHSLLLILLLWPSFFVYYVFLTFQPTHLLLPYYIIFLLGSIGLTALVSSAENVTECYIWTALLGGLALFGFVFYNEILFFTTSLLLLGLWAAWLVMRQYRKLGLRTAVALMLVAGVMMILGDHPSPRFRKLGSADEEKATLFMRDNLKPGSPVGAYQPINVWMAKLDYIPMVRSELPELNTDQDFTNWLQHNYLEALYVDQFLKVQEPGVWELIQRQIGRTLNVAFASDDGNVQVLFTTTKPSGPRPQYVERPWYSSMDRFKR